MLYKKSHQTGFTIVELLIVIVVIGILAAITIVAYNGIQERARATTVSSALSQAANKLAVYQVDYPDTYPADKTALEAIGIKDSTSVTYQYTRTASTPNTYCITATTGTTSYKISNTNTTPQQGGCAGHGVGGTAPITNLATNPSFETSLTGVSSFNVVNSNPSVGDAANGSRVLRATRNLTTGTTGPWWDAAGVTEGKTYQVTLSVRANHTLSRSLNIEWLNAAKSSILSTSTIVSGYTPGASWATIGGSATAPTGAAFIRLTLYGSGGGLTTDYVDIDSVIVTEGATQYNFADGNTTNWVWNGTANNSTSTGPSV
jgi:prepilin-type N-terminal cleavage/methylation domain-containing protein